MRKARMTHQKVTSKFPTENDLDVARARLLIVGAHNEAQDFLRDHVFNSHLLGSLRLMKRQKR
jgi:hypothetical protein